MGGLLGNILPLAVGMAISPVPVIAVILMLSSKDAIVNAVLFDAAWLFAIIATCAVFLLCLGGASISGREGTGTASAIIHIVFGILLLLLSGRRFLRRRAGVPEKQPKLLRSIATIGPASALLFGLVMVLLNPKNLVMLLSALAQVIQNDSSTAVNVTALAVFTLVASLGVLLPLAVFVLFRERAAAILASWKAWLEAHNSTVMMYLLLVLGVVLTVKGVLGLA